MKRLVLVPALCLLVSTGAFAQERNATQDKNANQERNNARRAVHPSGDIIGMDIRNTRNESLGHVEDLVVRLRDGKCVYVAMARGQVLGFGGSMFAVSPEALRMSNDGEHMILEATTQEFENAKGFDQNTWPREPDRRWGKAGAGANRDANPNQNPNANQNNRDANQNNFAGNREAGKGEDHLARISSLDGLYVYGQDDKQLGSVYDIALDCNKHQIAYVAVHHGGTLGIGGKLVAVGWDALTMKAPALDPQRRAFFLNTTQAEFERAPSFTTENWPAQPVATFKGANSNRGTQQQDN